MPQTFLQPLCVKGFLLAPLAMPSYCNSTRESLSSPATSTTSITSIVSTSASSYSSTIPWITSVSTDPSVSTSMTMTTPTLRSTRREIMRANSSSTTPPVISSTTVCSASSAVLSWPLHHFSSAQLQRCPIFMSSLQLLLFCHISVSVQQLHQSPLHHQLFSSCLLLYSYF